MIKINDSCFVENCAVGYKVLKDTGATNDDGTPTTEAIGYYGTLRQALKRALNMHIDRRIACESSKGELTIQEAKALLFELEEEIKRVGDWMLYQQALDNIKYHLDEHYCVDKRIDESLEYLEKLVNKATPKELAYGHLRYEWWYKCPNCGERF